MTIAQNIQLDFERFTFAGLNWILKNDQRLRAVFTYVYQSWSRINQFWIKQTT